MKKISHNKPCLDEKEIKAVAKVLKSNWLIPGIEVEKLENNVKKLVGTKYAVATSSGISAVHLSLIALGVGAGDEVILPTYTFAGLLNPINYIGAIPVLVDIEKNGFNIDPSQIKNKLTDKTKAIIVPHTFGLPAKIDKIKKFKIPVIEDCAHALGSYVGGQPLGSFGDLSIFSFYATKMIACGQGGMVVTNNKRYFDIIDDLIHYDQRQDYKVRYNYQLTDVAASIGNAQFAKLSFFIERRRKIALRYIETLEKIKNLQFWPKRQDQNLNYYRFIIKFDQKETRDEFKSQLDKNGISSIVPIENYQLLHHYLKLDKRQFPNAESLSQTTLSLPVHPNLTELEVEKIVKTLDFLCSKLSEIPNVI